MGLDILPSQDDGYLRQRSCDRNASSISRFWASGAPMAAPSP